MTDDADLAIDQMSLEIQQLHADRARLKQICARLSSVMGDLERLLDKRATTPEANRARALEIVQSARRDVAGLGVTS